MTSKTKIWDQNLALREGHFDYFQDQRTFFLEVVWGSRIVVGGWGGGPLSPLTLGSCGSPNTIENRKVFDWSIFDLPTTCGFVVVVG